MAVLLFLRQFLVASTSQMAAFAVGASVTYPGVLLQQLKTNASSIQIDFDTASWIGSLDGITGIPAMIMPLLMQWKGRKFAFLAACLISISGWIVTYTATTSTALLVSEALHGLGTHCVIVVAFPSISEMVSPKYRNIVMISFCLLQSLGMAVVTFLGPFLHWKTISIIMCVPLTIGIITGCLWIESPYWLAHKGQYNECEEAFVQLRGTDIKSKRELDQLILSAKEDVVNHKEIRTDVFNSLKQRDFYVPCLLILLLLNCAYWSGTVVMMIYFVEIVNDITTNKNVKSIASLVESIILVAGLAIVNILARFYNYKTIILGNVLLIALTAFSCFISTFLQTLEVLRTDSLLVCICLIAFMFSVSLTANNFTIATTLIPVKHRGVGGAYYLVAIGFLHTSSLKLAPYLFLYLQFWGTFLLYTINAIACGWLIFKYLPETKGKSLQEIQEFYIKN